MDSVLGCVGPRKGSLQTILAAFDVALKNFAQMMHARNVFGRPAIGTRYSVKQTQQLRVIGFCDGSETLVNERFFHFQVPAQQEIDLAHQRFSAAARALRQCIELDEQLSDTRVFSAQNGQRIHELAPYSVVEAMLFPANFVD